MILDSPAVRAHAALRPVPREVKLEPPRPVPSAEPSSQLSARARDETVEWMGQAKEEMTHTDL